MVLTRPVTSFADLMDGRKSAEILNPLAADPKKATVRRLVVVGDQIIIFAFSPLILRLPLKTPIRYSVWDPFDRGNLMFEKDFKICTEMDIIRYKDGTENSILAYRPSKYELKK